MHKTELDRLAIGLMVVLCSIWGLQQVAIKLASAGISPVWQAGLRSIGATVIVVVWALLRGVKLFERDRSLAPGLLAGALFAGEFAMIFLGLQHTSASRGVIFLYTAPFFVALGAVRLLPQEHMRRRQWMGMALAFVLFRILVFPGSPLPIGVQARNFLIVNAIGATLTFLTATLLVRGVFPAIGFTWHAETIGHALAIVVPVATSWIGHRRFTFADGVQIDQQQHELIPAQTRHGISTPQTGLKAFGHADQHQIADIMPPGIVNRLEAIQVQVADGHHVLVAPGQRHGMGNPVCQ